MVIASKQEECVRSRLKGRHQVVQRILVHPGEHKGPRVAGKDKSGGDVSIAARPRQIIVSG